MTPFKDEGLFRPHAPLTKTAPKSLPDYVFSQGNEVRNGLRIYNRRNLFYISSGEWLDEYETSYVSHEINPAVIGENRDTLKYTPHNDQDERKTAEEVLNSSEIIASDTIDYFDSTAKDGRITIFSLSARSLIFKEEYPYSTRGIKTDNLTFTGQTSGKRSSTFNDFEGSDLGITRQGYHGAPDNVIETFIDHADTNSLGYQIDYGDYDMEIKMGDCGTSIYSSVFGTDSIAYAGLLR